MVVTDHGPPEAVYTFDRAGRLFAAWVGGRFYRRALNGRIVEKFTVGIRPRRITYRRTLEAREADALVDRAAAAAREASAGVGTDAVEVLWTASGPRSLEEAARLAQAAAAFTSAAASADVRRYGEVYRPVGILPPDQYLALVLQVTEGCRWNRCTFCAFYRDQPFRVKPLSELAEHIQQVRAYLGEGLRLRRSLFLGEANALCLPTADLLPRLALIRRWFPDGGSRPMYSFMDIFTTRPKTIEEFQALRQQGLRRVYLGLESGDDTLLRWLNKPQQAAHAVEVVRTLKAAGLAVGVILMVGVGGDRFAAAHVEASRRLLAALPLDDGDLVYLSVLQSPPGGDYERAAREAGIHPLSSEALAAQLDALRAAASRQHGPRVAPYNIADFVY
ncbi:MAG TPA: radical SAM protein [bacterium]|nr:radical SAM protein [bacterium]